ncbi:hypothetical protein OO006_12115 [Prosthecochloris sp. SCSIO W1101]|uniref:hypothetical protein n=1 Tax=Prosthecochloris sp. SCSIO W1101 TaxID=2992242 RepID=UPI00223D8526|nr:hypothetical protein [Prosthecochloris sp. SCSIO W1101]UZJ41076.1 hypothetical protein OO006_12115 [Prosthecochloris sp. SCSIO W1101]
MDVKTVTEVEQEINRLRKGIENCMNHAMTCVDQCEPAEKAVTFSAIKKELEGYRLQLGAVTVMLDSLQKKALDIEGLCSETAAFLEKNLSQGLSAEDEGFSASSISPLA